MSKESTGNSCNNRSNTNDLNLLCVAALDGDDKNSNKISGAASMDTITGSAQSQAKGEKRKRKRNADSTGNDDTDDEEKGIEANKGAAADEEVIVSHGVLNVNPGDVLASLPKRGEVSNYFIAGDSRFESGWNDDSIFRLEAQCIDNKTYLFVSDEERGGWYRYKNIHVKGELPPLTCQRLYRVLAHGGGGCQFLTRIYGDMCVVNEMSNFMFLCDSSGPITSRGKLLSTTVDTFMKFFISSENYFEPIPFGVKTLIDVISAYGMMDVAVMEDWKDQISSSNRSEYVLTTLMESCEKALPQPMNTRKSNWWFSVVAHAAAFNRLLDAWNISKPAKANSIAIKCICCADASDRFEKKGFVNRNQNLNAILYGNGFELPFQTAEARGSIASAYTGHCPILSSETMKEKLLHFLDKKLFLKKTEFEDKNYFGVCATLFALHVVIRFYLEEDGIVRDVLSTITSEEKPKKVKSGLKDIMRTFTKKNTYFAKQFGGSDNLGCNTEIVESFANSFASIIEEGCPIALAIERAYSTFLAVQKKTLEDNKLSSHLEKAKEPLLNCGEKVAFVDAMRRRNKSSFALYSILSQFGVLRRYFYGPLLPILMREKGKQWVDANLDGDTNEYSKCNFQVAVAPAADAKMVELVMKALESYTIDVDFIKIADEAQTVLLPRETTVKEEICSMEGMDGPTLFVSRAIDVLLVKRRDVPSEAVKYAQIESSGGERALNMGQSQSSNHGGALTDARIQPREEEGNKSDDESTAFSLSR